MHPTRSGLLVEEFLRWDRLGRGDTVWDVPVAPEPCFVPFEWHGQHAERPRFADEGRREGGLLSALRSTRPSQPPEPQPESAFSTAESGEAPGYLTEDFAEVSEALWTVPDTVRWKPSDFEPFLYSLGAARQPVCFEILAARGKVELQWAVDPDDAAALADAVAALPFPNSLDWEDGRLLSALADSGLELGWSRDLCLAREFALPLRAEHHADPLGDLLAAMREGCAETLSLAQLRFAPCRTPWAASLWRLVTGDGGKPFIEDGQELLDGLKEKCRKPLYAATLRLTVMGEDEEDVGRQAERLLRALGRLDGTNSLALADAYDRTEEEELDEVVGRRWRRSGMVLGGDELLSLMHPPAAGLGAPALERLRRRTWPAPESCVRGFGAALGTCGHGGSRIPCGLRTRDRLRHMHVLGASGSGKSTLLLSLIVRDLEAGRGLALLDPHGDLVDAVLDRLPEERVKDVVLFDPADADWPVGFNILRAHSDAEKNLLASDFVAIFERLSTSWGDQMTAVLGNAAMAFLESDVGGTLMDLKRFLIEKGFRERFLKTVRDPEVRYFWNKEFPLLRGSTQASLLTRLNGFLRHRLVRNVVSQRGERFDVARMMDEGKVILAPLSQGLIGEENSWLLGSLLVSRVYQAALTRQSMAESERRPFFLYLDEAHNFLTPSVAAILSGARKYGLGLVLAHQELGQFPPREDGVLGAILANCHTRVCFRLGDADAKRLEGGFDHFEAGDFRRLRTGEAVCRAGSSDADFSLDCEPAPPASQESEQRRTRAVENSRQTYAAKRKDVERRDDGPGSPAPEPDPAPKSLQASPVPKPTEAEGSPLPTEKPPAPPAAKGPTTFEPANDPGDEKAMPGVPDDAGPPRLPGRGGTRHRQLQQLIKQFGNGLGLRASTEVRLEEGGGWVDVLLEGQSMKIAFEIADGSGLDQEVHNIAKSLSNGIDSVVVVSDRPDHLDAIREEAALQELGGEDHVSFWESSRMGDYFQALGASLASYETTSRGYRVRVKHVSISEEERQERLAAIHRAIAKHQAEGRGNGEGGS